MTAAARRRRARLTRTIRWASTLTALAIATVLWSTPHGILSAALAVVFLGCFLILAATLGAFRRPAGEER